jgi:hypothetical protein
VLYVVPSFSLGRPLHWDSPTLVAVGVVGLLGTLGFSYGVLEVCVVMILSGPVSGFVLGGRCVEPRA